MPVAGGEDWAFRTPHSPISRSQRSRFARFKETISIIFRSISSFLLMSSSVAPLLASEIPTLEGAIVPHWIGGKAIARQGDRRAPVYNPATGQVARFVPFASKEEVGAALSAASAPFPSWSAVPPLRPAPVLFPLQQLVYGLQRL